MTISMISARRSGSLFITFVTPVPHFLSFTVVRAIFDDKKDIFFNLEAHQEDTIWYDPEQCGTYRQLSPTLPSNFLQLEQHLTRIPPWLTFIYVYKANLDTARCCAQILPLLCWGVKMKICFIWKHIHTKAVTYTVRCISSSLHPDCFFGSTDSIKGLTNYLTDWLAQYMNTNLTNILWRSYNEWMATGMAK